MKTVVGLFNTTAEAQKVKQSLTSDGFDAGDIKIVATDHDDYSSTSDSSYTSGSTSAGTGVGDKISHFFKSLTGGDEDVNNTYAQGVNQGGALLTVTTDDEEAPEVASLLKQYGARDIDGNNQAAASGTPEYGGSNTQNLTGETAIPIVEEQLVVGKREVDRGGVRIYSHVVERPVEADVTLRDEHVNVERRPVSRAATEADFTTGAETFEVRASGEEAVVGKSSRVVEEVVVGKKASERTEAITDTVRKTEVEVEQIPVERTGTDRF